MNLARNRIDNAFFDGKAPEWRADQRGILRDINRHQEANADYLEEGIRLLDLTAKAEDLFRQRDHQGRRELLGYLVSESSWKDGKLEGTFNLPFNLIAQANAKSKRLKRAHRPSRIQSLARYQKRFSK